LSYTPYRNGQGPLSKGYPAPAQIASDLALIATQANGIRTYTALEGSPKETARRLANGTSIAALAQKAGLKLWLGIWLGADPASNQEQMAAAIAVANAYPDTVTRIVVGNEVLLRRDLSVEDLIADIDYVRGRVKQPVAYADVTDFWKKYPQVAPHVDVVMIHILPYWENKPLSLDDALAGIQSTITQFKTLFPGKQISIGETGWPSRGRWRGAAAPSRVNEAVYLRRFAALAAQNGVDYNVIEAFDQGWKYKQEGVAGANWGIWNAHRVLKFPLNGAVTERPSWPWYALLGALLGCALFASVGFRNLRLAVPAFALGNGFAIACIGTLPLLYDKWQWLGALVNLPLQLIFAFRIIGRTDDVLAKRPLPPVMNGAAVLASLRRFRVPFTYDGLWFIFLASAPIFQAILVLNGRYFDAPTPVFIIPIIAAVLRFWSKDKPSQMGWEELLASFALAVLALADLLMEGQQNLDFVVWNVGALVLAAPCIMAAEGKKGRRKVKKAG
ncbi:MAG TPA: glycoside hydrolase, partial [Acidocella sp.]|nr:glycoside hydrolase [Acidocella sp.]